MKNQGPGHGSTPYDAPSLHLSSTPLFPGSGVRRVILLLVLFASALLLRLSGLDDPPLQFHPTRQYISALLARALYAGAGGEMTTMERTTALAARPAPGEPPVVEHAARVLYGLAGREDPALPRVLSVLLWLAAALLLHQLARRLFGPDAAVLAAAYFLFVPFGVAASRAFMPDPLMVALVTASLLAMERWRSRPGTGSFLLLVLLSASAAFVKPVCLPLLWGAFFGFLAGGAGVRSAAGSARFWIFVAATILPAAVYFGYGIAFSPQMREFAEGRFAPSLVLRPQFWKEAASMAFRVAGPAAFVASLFGTLLAPRGHAQGMLAGLWAGYAAFVLIFALHTHTHDYYHLLLLPPVALGAGVAGSALLAPLATGATWKRVAAGVVLVAGVLIAVDASRGSLPAWGHEDVVAVYRRAGEAAGHSAECLFLADAYGLPLQYHGRVAGRSWPTAYDFHWEAMTGAPSPGAQERLEQMLAGKPARFFIATDLAELERQSDLRAILARYPLVAADSALRVYDLADGARRPKAEGSE